MEMATKLVDPWTRCEICGLPNYLLEVYRKTDRLPWFFGKNILHTMQVDHIVPGDNTGGLRPLCPPCNKTRGAAIFTDDEVLHSIRGKWRDSRTLKLLWWLNDTPGEGGRLHRSEACEKRETRFDSHVLGRVDEG